jgi:hypothetical protein
VYAKGLFVFLLGTSFGNALGHLLGTSWARKTTSLGKIKQPTPNRFLMKNKNKSPPNRGLAVSFEALTNEPNSLGLR